VTVAAHAAKELRRTPLFDVHIQRGGKMVDFAGWSLAVEYPTGIVAEHKQCRATAAVFDVSHMGQLLLKGDNPARALEALVPSALEGLKPGKARYSVLTNDAGGILDDLIISNTGDELFLVVNAATRERDIRHLASRLPSLDIVELADRALLAIQGPASPQVVAELMPGAPALNFMETMAVEVLGVKCRVSRLGYTGEDGFELSVPATHAADIGLALLDNELIRPAGLGARDTLRLEAGLCLYGQDLDESTSPVEAQLSWVIQKRRREEGGFPGARRILGELSEGPKRKLVGLRPQGRAPARHGVEITSPTGEAIGAVTSGGFSPTLGAPISIGYVSSAYAEPGSEVGLRVRHQLLPAIVTELRFVPHRYKR
jgi:aminomethyltransferase